MAASWASGSRWEEALCVLADAETAAAAVQATSRAACIEAAVHLLRRLPSDPKLSTSLVAACGKVFEWRSALQVFGHLQENDVADVIAYNATMTACSNAHQWTQVLQLLEELTSTFTHSKWEAEETRGNLRAFTAAMDACKSAKKWALALLLFEQISEQVVPDLPAFGAVIANCAVAGRWMQVLCLLESMGKLKIEVDVAHQTALIDAMAKKSEWSRAVATLNRIVLDGGQHFHDFTGPAVESCQAATQWEVALHLWQMFPSIAAGHCLLLALHQVSLEPTLLEGWQVL